MTTLILDTPRPRARNKLVSGVGINDADYPVKFYVDGDSAKQRMCPFYAAWTRMLHRVYSPKYHAKYPTYVGCSVDATWIVFSSFKAWMATQEWENRALDKDILFPGNKLYSPDTCVFVSRELNNFLTDCGRLRGEYPIGVSWNVGSRKFAAHCSDPRTGKNENLGLFTCEKAAHKAWLTRKHEHACMLADLQSDPRVSNALRTRYSHEYH